MTSEAIIVPRAQSLPEKVCGQHRDRQAIVYIRQSTLQQVERNQESTRLQYALVDRAFALGWPREAIVVVDDDLGRSGASMEGRLGFQRLVAEVGLGRVGLVLGVEMSRLARSCRDWHQLLEICALFDTLIADADGVYDPSNFNDRLLLGLKGTMSEAELHIIKARMLEGRRAKARRGELAKSLPAGYVARPSGEVIFEPDEQAQGVIRLIFDLFERLRSVGGVLRYLNEHNIQMPIRRKDGPTKGDLEWRRPSRATLHNLFNNPIYAGVYAWGARPVDRRRQKPGRPGTGRCVKAPDNVEVFLPDRLPAYISLEQFESTQAQIRANLPSAQGPVRAGSALLSGMVICGACGLRMQPTYNNNGQVARYICNGMQMTYAEPICQSLKAAPVDEAVSRAILQSLEPAALEISLAVASDLEAERKSLDRQWQQRLERAQFEVDRARRSYASVEPENRLVARSLEKSWEEALASQARLMVDYDRFQRERLQAPSRTELEAIRNLTQDLPALWQATTTTQRERQEIVRLLLERVIIKMVDDTEHVEVTCHWHGGNQTMHKVIRPVARITALSSYPALIARMKELYEAGNSSRCIANILNDEGFVPPKRRNTYTPEMVRHRLVAAGIAKPQRKKPSASAMIVREPDEWTIRELAEAIGMPQATLYYWVACGRLSSRLVKQTRRTVKLVTADAAMIADLKAIRASPPHLKRLPPRQSAEQLNLIT
jgi:DNA invertase Pin-like site-specific DNA recombinase